MLYKDMEGNIVGESIFENGDIPDLLISIEFLGPVLWALIKNEDGTYFRDSTDYHIEPVLSQELIKKLDKLYEILMTSFDSSYPPDSGFKTIEEVKYFLYYQVYVAILLSSEYKQGKILLYGKDHTLCSIEEYVKYLSTLTDEDLKVSLRADLQ